MHCTVFLPSENEIVTEMRGPGGDYNDMVTNHPAHQVLQRNAERHRGDSWRQGKPEPLGSKEGGGPWEAREITEEGKFSVLGGQIKSCRHLPTHTTPEQAPKTRMIFATDEYITYKWKQPAPNPGHVFHTLSEEAVGTQDGFQKNRIKIQEMVMHSQARAP